MVKDMGVAVICSGEVMEIEMAAEEICNSTAAVGKHRRKDQHRWTPHWPWQRGWSTPWP